MKVLLLFPPSWHPSQPYLSLPSLTAFLRKHGVCDVVQRDLNIELLDVLLTRKKCVELFQRITDKLKRLEGVPPVDSIDEERRNALAYAAQTIPSIMDKVEYAKDALRSKDFYDLAKYMEGVHTVNEYLGLVSTLYFPSMMTALHNDMRYSVYSSAEILRALDDEEENIFRDLYKSHVLSSILSYSPQLVGISITSTAQIIPGLTIARLIKAEKKDVHITVGGSVFTKLVDNLRQGSDLFSVVDSFIMFEGERALLELVKQVDGAKEFKKVPNLVYLEDGAVKVNEPFCTEDLNGLPTPDFDGLPLNLYHAPASVLPIQTSRGCYYRKCAFCNLHLDHGNFRLRRTDLLMEDIRILSQKYDTRNFFFTDESVPINKLREISQLLIEKQWGIKWMGGVRFENVLSRDLLESMAKSGCQKLVFGLESYSQRLLDLMKKGTKTDVVKRILDDCLAAGIAFHLYIIVGFPTETAEEAEETLGFVLRKEYLTSRGYSCLPSLFGMEKDSPLTHNPAEYGISSIMAPKSEDLGLGYFYDVERGMSVQEAEQMYQHVIGKLSDELCPFPYNYSMPDGLLYIVDSKKRSGGGAGAVGKMPSMP